MTQKDSAIAETEHASRYLQQLGKHWSHKAEVSVTPETATITFPNGNHLTMQATPNHLTLAVSVPTDGDLAHFRDVVDRHILRFAFREDLTILWD